MSSIWETVFILKVPNFFHEVCSDIIFSTQSHEIAELWLQLAVNLPFAIYYTVYYTYIDVDVIDKNLNDCMRVDYTDSKLVLVTRYLSCYSLL